MTSEAIDESGVNVFMFALALGNREGALTLRIKSSRCERTERHGTTQTGQENGNTCVFKTIRCLLFLYAGAGAMRDAVASFAFWPSVCGKHHLRRIRQSAVAGRPRSVNNPINAFLTLTAVTKW